MTQTARVSRYTAFASVALLVNALMYLGPSRIHTALFFDCAITVPVCYWLLLVRPGLRGPASLALISAVSVMRGAYLLHSTFGMGLGVLAELGLVFYLATQRLEDILPSRTMARIARAEIDVYRYAFRRRSSLKLPHGSQAFKIHEASGASSLFWLIAAVTPCEAAAVHFLLPQKLAWIFTFFSVYGAIWAVAVARSFTALPIVIDAQGITLHKGLLSKMYVPRDAIASFEPSKDCARFAVLAEPTVWLTFNRPLTLELPMGFTRQVTGVSLAPDDLTGFRNALNGN